MTAKAGTMMRRMARDANMALADRGLAPFMFGNASGIDVSGGSLSASPPASRPTSSPPT